MRLSIRPHASWFRVIVFLSSFLCCWLVFKVVNTIGPQLMLPHTPMALQPVTHAAESAWCMVATACMDVTSWALSLTRRLVVVCTAAVNTTRL